MMRHVLLLGSDPGTTLAFRSRFEPAGIALASAEIVEPVEDFIRLAQPSAVLLDVSSAGNFEEENLLRRISSQSDFQRLPIFALTGAARANQADSKGMVGSIRVFEKLADKIPDIIAEVARAVGGSLPSPTAPTTEPRAPEKTAGADGRTPDTIPAPLEPASGNRSSAAFPLSDLLKSFLSAAEADRGRILTQMQEDVRELRRRFLAAGRQASTAFTSAVARLLIALSKDVSRFGSSSYLTLSSAIELLNKASSVEPRAQAEQLPIRALIVDSDSLGRRGLQYALASPDLEVMEAASIDEALAYVSQGAVDVIFVSDRLLGTTDSDPTFPRTARRAGIHLIVVTSGLDLESSKPRHSLSGSDTVAKPFNPSEVVLKAFTLALRRRFNSSLFGVTRTDEPNRPSPSETAPAIGPKTGSASVPLSGAARPASDAGSERLPGNQNGKSDVVQETESPSAKAPEPDGKLQAMEATLRTQETLVAQEQARRRELEEQLQRLRQTHENSLAELNSVRSNSEKEAQEAAARSAALEANLRQVTAAHEESMRNVALLQSRLGKLEAALSAEQTVRLKLQEDSRQARAAEQELRQQMLRQAELGKDLQARVDQVTNEKAQLEARLKELEEHPEAPNSAEGNTAEKPAVPSPSSFGAELRRKLEEMNAYQVLANEFSQAKDQLLQERLRAQSLEAKLRETEAVKADAERKVQALSDQIQAEQKAAQAIQAQLAEVQDKLAKSEASLQAASNEVRQLRSRTEELETRLDGVSSQVRSQAVIEQAWRRQEAELQACVQRQEAELASARAALAAESTALHRAKERIQSTLCRMMQELGSDDLVRSDSKPAACPEE